MSEKSMPGICKADSYWRKLWKERHVETEKCFSEVVYIFIGSRKIPHLVYSQTNPTSIKAGFLDAPLALRDFSRSNKQKEIQNNLLRNINDNDDNNEKKKIKKFKNMGENILGGNFPGGIHQGGIWWVGTFRMLIFQGKFSWCHISY